ncbi:GL12292 [Drosophila persimilis]|uniref:Fatty acid synthase n=1 Tax=Drosophila persimilis TaxID=7234 RepID=B4GM93_DROPE|nr:GL12292 [Drosophila persimilis]
MVDDDERRWRHFNPEIPKRSGKISDLEKFDATFFGVHFKQAHTMDPQTRILIETAYEAVIDSGINPKSLRGSKTGVYVGSCISESEKTWFYEKVSSGGFGITGCSRAMMANRISYSLGLEGPSFLLDTACSSSMYALDNAFSAIRNGEIDAAIIGGSNLLLHPFVTLQFARLGVLAQDGFCRPFDKDASGYTRSETINCLFLQRKRDAKRVYASVIYSKTNCDGYKPEGITYPSGKVQEKLLDEFYKEIEVTPNDLGYLEAHSTGTVVGDPEECKAIDNVLCSQRQEPLLVGSVKSNVGHSEAASGICSLVKACFAFETGFIAPNINFTEVKSVIAPLAEGRLIVVKDVTPLPKPCIGINSFGFGGANAHALLKAYPKAKANFGLPEDDIPRILTWAGRTEEAVNEIFNAVEKKPLDAEFIGLLQNIQESDVSGMVFRGYAIFGKQGEAPAKALVRDVQHYTGLQRPIVWVYSGMGSQWPEMGASLMVIPRFRESIEICHQTLKPKGVDLIHILTSNDPTIYQNILHSFVGIAAVQIGLTDVLRSLNLEPDFIIGHSVGELGCAYADGGLTPQQMILAAYYRGRVSVDVEKIRGSMAAVGIGYKSILHMLPESIEVACHNGPDSCTISGPVDDVTRFVDELKAKSIFAKEVPCSNIAYHSKYIAHMGPPLLQYMMETVPNPKMRTDKWLSTSVPKSDWDQAERKLCSAQYHTNNLLSSVLFEETFALLPKNALTIEIAPHGLLGAILKRSMPSGVHIPLTNRGNKNNALFFLSALGKTHQNGLMVPVSNLYGKIDFPVSRATPSISSLIRWDHSEDWFVTKYENMKTKSSGERIFPVNLASDNEEFMSGHVIDGKILVPATSYLQYVWETFSLMYHGPSYMDVPVEFEDVRFLRATNMSVNGDVELNVMIHYGTGHFEGTWGSLRHLKLPKSDKPMTRLDHIYGNVIQRGDLSTLRWFEGPLNPQDCMIKIAYSSLNFRDVMLATGRLAVELYGSSRIDQNCVLGFEYSGINTVTGRRIMSMVVKGGVASYVEKPSKLIWDIPDHWSLKEAATVPVVYITVYYAFFMASDIRKGKSILIHAGTGGIGLAAIRVALAYNLEVFTTCSTPQKKQFLLDTFPQLKESNIGNSRDTSFELMIQRETDGNGVDFVLNSLSEDKLLASVRCLGKSGHFLEIGKFDMANDSKLGMGCFLKEITFHAVLADSLLVAPEEDIWHLKSLIDADISKGIIQPLPVQVFPAHEIEQAFRHLIGGKHIGKVVIQVRDTPENPATLPVRVMSQIYFKPNLSYVIPGGLGGFGMELADWMALRGARKLILSSSRGITKDYQSYRIALWKTYGCEVVINTADISTIEGCQKLLSEASKLGPVGGIFNLAVMLRDAIFSNQSLDQFVESFAPKAVATKHLDTLSRVFCPELEHFVVFSSVSCGRGNAGQTNYGMANSIMERIIECRHRDGLPGKAIQWGAVGEVGLVADMAEDKIDMEIGGTLQQRIASCLQELDYLLSAESPIVASMVVAEKRSGRSGNESIIDAVMNIMGIRDLKSVSLGTTLSEMGMDSLMAVEIKQTLERDFELVLSPQDLRSLTFQKLQEFVEAKEGENTDDIKMIFASDSNLLGMDLLLRNLGDEAHCDQVMIPLNTSAAPSKQSFPPNIIIPGLEGTAGQAWYHIGSNLQSRAVVLQLHQFASLETVQEIAEQSLEFWYKPHMTREEAVMLLRTAQVGTFLIRNSTTYRDSYGLVLRVAKAPPSIPSTSGNGDELVRHFLLEPTNRGIRLKGCANEPIFTSLSAFVYQHSINSLALPCTLVIPYQDLLLNSPDNELMSRQKQILVQGAACNVLYLYQCDTESLTGLEAVRKSVHQMYLDAKYSLPIEVHLKISQEGITLTDNTRKTFFRRHYPAQNISHFSMDPNQRFWSVNATDEGLQRSVNKSIFAFVARPLTGTKDNQCHIFCDLASSQPASAIVSFANKVLPLSKSSCKML